MPLDIEVGKTMLQLITSRYDDRHWRKKIEKTLGLPQSGVGDSAQQQIFMYLKIGLKAYKSRRADPDSWIVGGYATKEIVERAKFQPQLVGPDITKDDVAFLGSDPGKEIDRKRKKPFLTFCIFSAKALGSGHSSAHLAGRKDGGLGRGHTP